MIAKVNGSKPGLKQKKIAGLIGRSRSQKVDEHSVEKTQNDSNMTLVHLGAGRGKDVPSASAQDDLNHFGRELGTDDETDFEIDYPEGGKKAYLVVFGSFCAMTAGFGILNSVGTLQAYVSTHQLKQYDDSTISWIFSLYLFLVFVSGLQIGPIFDKYGPVALIIVGSICETVSLLLLGICTRELFIFHVLDEFRLD